MRNSLKTWLVAGLLLSTIGYAVAEDITLTTYYPSPRGVYKELQVGNLTLFPPGNLQLSGSLAVGPGMSPGNPGEVFANKLAVGATALPPNTTLLVEGNIKTTGNIMVDLTHGILTEQGTGLRARVSASGQEESLWLQSMGAAMLFITPTGVGIGAQEPISALHIQDGRIVLNANTAPDELVIAEAPGSPDTEIRMIYQGLGGAGPPQAAFSMAVDAAAGGRFAIRDRTGAPIERLVINSAGNIGVGTGSPQSPSPANNVSTGNLDANDVFLRSTGKWASQGGGETFSCQSVVIQYFGGNQNFSCPANYQLVLGTCDYANEPVLQYQNSPHPGLPNWASWLIEPNALHCPWSPGAKVARLRCCK